jgi:hypothetical protein
MLRYFIHIVFVVLSCHVVFIEKNSLVLEGEDKDQTILVPTTNTIRWGRRVYYFDCHRKGQQYSWYADNLASAPGAPDAAGINPHWVFRDKWDPEKEAQQ